MSARTGVRCVERHERVCADMARLEATFGARVRCAGAERRSAVIGGSIEEDCRRNRWFMVCCGECRNCETAALLSGAIGELLPAAAVALSPIPIVAIVFVLDGPKARGSGPAFAVAWFAGLTIVTGLVVLITGAASDPGSDAATGVDWLMAAIGRCFS
jgi:Sap-like sulfolipid-1-addressing protein